VECLSSLSASADSERWSKQSGVQQAQRLIPNHLTGPAYPATPIIALSFLPQPTPSSRMLMIDSHTTTRAYSSHSINPHYRPPISYPQPPPQPLEPSTSPKTDNGKMDGHNHLGTPSPITRKRRTTSVHKSLTVGFWVSLHLIVSYCIEQFSQKPLIAGSRHCPL
jgi:hypothetical protein